MAHVIVGTAGHIDHGKSALVRALTGTDPDRLPEEKRRGITIDLGYAFLDDVAAIIDVPGHEKFIHNMVAGAATIDYALLVVAADDGVMPQTVEHLHILRLLGVSRGVVAITKCDTVETDWLELVEAQVRSALHGTFLETAPLFRVDSLSGRGVAELRTSLLRQLAALARRLDRGVFRLPIDRVFTIKGHGTIVTGTVLSGSVSRDARLVALPGGVEVRVKHLESHGQEVTSLGAGERAALNLIGKTELLTRGHTLSMAGGLPVSRRLRGAVELLPGVPPFKDRQRIRFLIGTQEVIGRIRLLERVEQGRMCAHVALEEDVVAVWGDRFVIRRYSPLETLGGGTVLEPMAPSLKARDLGRDIALAHDLDGHDIDGALSAFIRVRGAFGIPSDRVAAVFGLPAESLWQRLRDLGGEETVRVGGYLLLRARLAVLSRYLKRRLAELHDKSAATHAFSRADLYAGDIARFPESVFEHALESMVAKGEVVRDGALFRDPERHAVLSPAQLALNSEVLSLLRTHGFAPPSAGAIADTLKRSRADVEKTLVLLDRMGRCKRLGVDLFFDADCFDHAVAVVRAAAVGSSGLTVAEASRLLSSSRKYVVPFLEYLDGRGVTKRLGDVRISGPNCGDE